MCYSKEASIKAYIIGIVLSSLLFVTGDKYDKNIALFCFIFIQMQLVEYFMWSDPNCGLVNKYATRSGEFVLLLQPVSILLGAYIYNTLNLPKYYVKILLLISLGPIIIWQLGYYLLYRNNLRKSCSRAGSTGYLEWSFLKYHNKPWHEIARVIWLGLFFIPWLFFKDRLKGILIFALLSLTLLYSIIPISYGSINNLVSFSNIFRQWESKWCYIGVLIPLIFLILNFIKK